MNKQIAVFVGVCIRKDKILMTQRFEERLPDAHLKWELPGGKCDYGETPAQAIVREFQEEAGVEVSAETLYPLVYTHYWKYADGTRQTFVFVYKCKFVKKLTRQTDKRINDVAWIPLHDVLKLDLLGGTETILKQTVFNE